MAAAPVELPTWAAGVWADTVWEEDTWSDSTPAPGVAVNRKKKIITPLLMPSF